MNDDWRRRHAEAHERYSQLKDRMSSTDAFARLEEFEALDRELAVAERELKAINKERAAALGAD